MRQQLDDLCRELQQLRASIEARQAQEAQEAQQIPQGLLVTSAMEREAAAAVVMAAGRHFERELDDIESARSRYRDVLTYFPETRAAAEARNRLETPEATAI